MLDWWLRLFKECIRYVVMPEYDRKGRVKYTRKIERYTWPDGGAFTEQEMFAVDVFEVMLDEVNRSLVRGR